jgi:hypothetical protein
LNTFEKPLQLARISLLSGLLTCPRERTVFGCEAAEGAKAGLLGIDGAFNFSSGSSFFFFIARPRYQSRQSLYFTFVCLATIS